MKILYIINALTVGGAQILLLDLVKEFAASGNQIVAAAFRGGDLAKKLEKQGCKVVLLGESFFDIIAFYKLIRILCDFQPHIIHTHLFRATAWARLAKFVSRSKAKLITTVHGAETNTYHLIESFMQPLSDYILFPSQFLADWYSSSIKRLSDKKFKVFYPGVVVASERQFSKTNGKVIIGTLSRLHFMKGIDLLLKAAEILKEKGFVFEIKIGGGGRGKEELEKLVGNLKLSDTCDFVDEIPNKSDYLESLDIFVSPSRKEAFGINMCEAMERSLPIVASRVDGIPEVVEDGNNALLFESENSKDLADKLALMIENPELRQKMGENGRKRVEQLFNREKALKDHMLLYKEMTDKKRVHFVVSSRELGGGERLALDLISNLQNRGWTVTATCAGNPLYKKLLALGIKASVASMRLGGVLFATKLLLDLKQFEPRVISSHLNKGSLFSGLLSKIINIPCISHIHGLNKKIYYQFSTKQIAVSKAVKEHILQQGGNSSTLVTINNCINRKPVGIRNFPKRPLNIVITAKLHENKGHAWALKAIAENIVDLNIGKIHLFGSGPESDNLQRFCHSLKELKDRVIFHGFVNDPTQYYKDMDIALLPSLGEGIPLSLLEVMSFGIPCISTNIGGVPEIIDNNESGILVEPKDDKALIAAIKRISEKEEYEKFSLAALNRFKQVNNHEKMVDDFEKLLLEAI